MEETMSELKKQTNPRGRAVEDHNGFQQLAVEETAPASSSIISGDLEGDTYQFDVEGASSVCDIACYRQDGAYMIAVATDDHNVLSYSYCSGNTNNDLFAESKFNTVLLRFTATINTLDVNVNDTLLAAGSSCLYLGRLHWKMAGIDNDKLAHYEMSGGDIKSAIFRAAARAALTVGQLKITW